MRLFKEYPLTRCKRFTKKKHYKRLPHHVDRHWSLQSCEVVRLLHSNGWSKQTLIQDGPMTFHFFCKIATIFHIASKARGQAWPLLKHCSQFAHRQTNKAYRELRRLCKLKRGADNWVNRLPMAQQTTKQFSKGKLFNFS